MSATAIVNGLEKAWDLFKDGKHVPGFESKAANAVPQGIDPMADLDAWMGPNRYEFRYYSENTIAGHHINTISDVTMSLQWSFAGRYTKGKMAKKGMFLNNVRVTMDNSSGTIGDKLNIKVEFGTPENTGTDNYPIAGLPIYVIIEETPSYTLNAHSETRSFYLWGSGAIQEH
jgi:hypothetical protein